MKGVTNIRSLKSDLKRNLLLLSLTAKKKAYYSNSRPYELLDTNSSIRPSHSFFVERRMRFLMLGRSVGLEKKNLKKKKKNKKSRNRRP